MDQSPTPQPESQPPVTPPEQVPTPPTFESLRAAEPVQPTPVQPVAPSVSEAPVSSTAPEPQEIVPTLDQTLNPDVVEDGVPDEASFAWQASEYIHHEKSMMWYGVLAVVFLAMLTIAYFTKQWLSIGVFIVMAVAIVVYARKPPRTLTYELSNDGISIDGHLYPFDQFRSFAVLPDLSWHTIDLEPTRRFMPRLSILFETENFDAVVGHLSEYLPRADRQPDAVERLTRYLRF